MNCFVTHEIAEMSLQTAESSSIPDTSDLNQLLYAALARMLTVVGLIATVILIQAVIGYRIGYGSA